MAETQIPHPPLGSVDELVELFIAGAIDEANWTHAAHLFVCRHLLATEPTVGQALDRMRSLICAHNARVAGDGGQGAYHETVTRYFVEAVHHAGPRSDVALLTEPTCRRDAPRSHWSAGLLASPLARTTWVEPDLRPLPWPPSS